ncbi:MAG: NAD+ synthase [Verrucomicrobia bacterium]|nr:NAD+ synthase [Verrucomicrobiota bacterium]
MNIGLAQINTTVGDFAGNAATILAAYHDLVALGAELVVTPELAVTGYPPLDLIFAGEFVERNLATMAEIHASLGDVPLVVGFIDRNTTGHGKPFFNAAAFLRKGKPPVVIHKRLLPTYDVFDEARYFEPGVASAPVEFDGKKLGITICEDLWTPEFLPGPLYRVDPPADLVAAGAEILINLSASPFQYGKPIKRMHMLSAQAKRFRAPVYYCNSIGGNDQLVFDGHSLVISADGTRCKELAGFDEELAVVDNPTAPFVANHRDELGELYRALVLGLRDYFRKCGFQSAVLGLSGGIDSALTAVLAVEALGKENVTGAAMPGPYSSEGSVRDARLLAKTLGIKCLNLPITHTYEVMNNGLEEVFADRPEDATEENLQARLRGITMMALSNKFGSLLLTTGNKSELAVGYCTLYGDMCGGLAVISDLPKTLVYSLSRWINRESEIIPARSIEKAPSAELRPDQKDQDSLPPYDLLDAILALYVEENLPLREIVARGYDEALVRRITGMVDRNEYKREQAAPGLKVTGRAFGMGRRLPLAQRYTP